MEALKTAIVFEGVHDKGLLSQLLQAINEYARIVCDMCDGAEVAVFCMGQEVQRISLPYAQATPVTPRPAPAAPSQPTLEQAVRLTREFFGPAKGKVVYVLQQQQQEEDAKESSLLTCLEGLHSEIATRCSLSVCSVGQQYSTFVRCAKPSASSAWQRTKHVFTLPLMLVLRSVAAEELDLWVLNVRGIPMKDSAKGMGPTSFDVQLLFQAPDHAIPTPETVPLSNVLATRQLEVFFGKPKNASSVGCRCLHPATPLELMSKPSVTLLKYIAKGACHLRNQAGAITHVVSCHDDQLFVHCLAALPAVPALPLGKPSANLQASMANCAKASINLPGSSCWLLERMMRLVPPLSSRASTMPRPLIAAFEALACSPTPSESDVKTLLTQLKQLAEQLTKSLTQLSQDATTSSQALLMSLKQWEEIEACLLAIGDDTELPKGLFKSLELTLTFIRQQRASREAVAPSARNPLISKERLLQLQAVERQARDRERAISQVTATQLGWDLLLSTFATSAKRKRENDPLQPTPLGRAKTLAGRLLGMEPLDESYER